MMKKLIGMIVLAIVSASTSADYTVQIGAYERPELANHESAASVAKVYTLKASSGLTRIMVGRFDSSADAQSALDALKAGGYRDAFITRSNGSVSEMSAVQPARSRRSGSARTDRNWNHLSSELRAKLVILDGRPHIKEGDRFTPLEQHLRQ